MADFAEPLDVLDCLADGTAVAEVALVSVEEDLTTAELLATLTAFAPPRYR